MSIFSSFNMNVCLRWNDWELMYLLSVPAAVGDGGLLLLRPTGAEQLMVWQILNSTHLLLDILYSRQLKWASHVNWVLMLRAPETCTLFMSRESRRVSGSQTPAERQRTTAITSHITYVKILKRMIFCSLFQRYSHIRASEGFYLPENTLNIH